MKKAIELLKEAGGLVDEGIIETAYCITVNPCYNIVDIQGDMDADKLAWLVKKTDIHIDNDSGIISGSVVTESLTVRVVLT